MDSWRVALRAGTRAKSLMSATRDYDEVVAATCAHATCFTLVILGVLSSIVRFFGKTVLENDV